MGIEGSTAEDLKENEIQLKNSRKTKITSCGLDQVLPVKKNANQLAIEKSVSEMEIGCESSRNSLQSITSAGNKRLTGLGFRR